MVEPQKQPATRKRWPYVMGVLFVLLVAMVFIFSIDDDRGDHSDLLPKRDQATPESVAAYNAWLVAFGKMDKAPIEAAFKDKLFFARLSGTKPWAPAPVEKIITANRDALAAAKAADALGLFSPPRTENFAGTFPEWNGFQKMASLLRIAAVERLVAGDPEGAYEFVRLGVNFAGHNDPQGNSLIGLLVALSCEAIALSGADRMVVAETPDAVLLQLDRLLSQEIDTHAWLIDAWRNEFLMFSNTVDDFENLHSSFGPPSSLNNFSAVLLKKNRTINRRAEDIRGIITNVTLPAGSRIPLEARKPNWFSSNVIGEMMLVDGSSAKSFVEKADNAVAHRRLLRLKIALLRHHCDKSSLPAALADLVPTYIEAVPADPFDGKPLRYDQSRGAVWVLGTDLDDDGGSAAPHPQGFSHREADPTMFVFPAPATTP